MNKRKLNQLLGAIFILVGALRLILIFLGFLNIISIISAISTTEITSTNASNVNFLIILSYIYSYAKLAIFIATIALIIQSKKDESTFISKYILGLGALLFDYFMPALMSFEIVIIKALFYIYAGTKIMNFNFTKTEKRIENTNWFYEDK